MITAPAHVCQGKPLFSRMFSCYNGKKLREGISFMNICVFGASSDAIDPAYFAAAEALGACIARGGHRLIFGGGREGLMGACARGLLREGGTALGIAPRFFDEPGILMKEDCDFLFTETMSERKKLMEDMSDAFIALPGGIGTYEEFFETLTLKQLGQHCKPMVMLNTLGYFDPFVALLQTTAEKRFMSAKILGLFRVCAEPEAALQALLADAARPAGARSLADYSK